MKNEPSFTVDSPYTDTALAATDHNVVNNPGQWLVDSTASGSSAAGDLGFNARWEFTSNSLGELGLTSEYVGVVRDIFGIFPGGFTDGVQGYVIGDADGRMVLEFDPVDISTTPASQVELDVFVGATSWEVANESLKISVIIDGSTIVSLLDTTRQDLDNLPLEGNWTTISADLTGLGSSAVLIVVGESDANTERFAIDRVTFTGNVPEPTTSGLALLAFFSTCVVWRRRFR